MRETDASGWMVRKLARRGLWLATVTLSIGFVMASGPVRAADDDDDDKTFEEKIIEGIMRGIGGTNMENRGIEYRERSPLVVPPKIDLPPPGKRPSRKLRRTGRRIPTSSAARPRSAARKKENKDPVAAARVLTPSRTRSRQDHRADTHQFRPDPAGHFGHQLDPEPVAARLYRRLQRHVRRQQGRDGAVQGRADA